MSDDTDFDLIMAQKLKQLKDFQGQKLKTLEQKTQQQQTLLNDLKNKYNELQQDFQYNLQVIQQRDREIAEMTEKLYKMKEIIDKVKQDKSRHEDEVSSIEQRYRSQISKQKDQINTLYQQIEDLQQQNQFYQNSYQEEAVRMKEDIKKLRSNNEDTEKAKTEIQQKIIAEFESLFNKSEAKHKLEVENLEKLLAQARADRSTFQADLKRQNERLLFENEKLLKETNTVKEKGLDREQELCDQIISIKTRLSEQNLHILALEKENENFQSSNSSWEKVMKEQIDMERAQRERLNEELSRYKMKHKQKIRDIRETTEKEVKSIREQFEQARKKADLEKREFILAIDRYEIAEKGYKDRLAEKDALLKRELNDLQSKNEIFLRNFQEEKRQQKNQIEMKQFHLTQAVEQKQELAKKIENLQKTIESHKSKHLEIEKENLLLIEEVVRFRQEFNAPIQNKSVHQAVEEKKDLIGQNRYNHLQDNHNNNNNYNNNNNNYNNNNNNNNNTQKNNSNSPQRNDSRGQNFRMRGSQFEEDQGARPPMPGVDGASEVESFEPLFSDDMGPVSPMASQIKRDFKSGLGGKGGGVGGAAGSSNFNRSAAQHLQMVKKVKELEAEISAYKTLIDTMTREMENAKHKISFNNQELNFARQENMHLRNRISEFQFDNHQYQEKLLRAQAELEQFRVRSASPEKEEASARVFKEELDARRKQVEALEERMAKAKGDVAQLVQERDDLIQISNNLSAQIFQLEERLNLSNISSDFDLKPKDTERLIAEREIALKRIQELEAQLDQLKSDYDKLRNLDRQKQMIIQQLKDELINERSGGGALLPKKISLADATHQKFANQQKANKAPSQGLPKYDQFEQIDKVPGKDSQENFGGQNNNRLGDEENKRNFNIEANAKPLMSREADDSQKSLNTTPQIKYRKNSDRETDSQKEQKSKTSTSPAIPQKNAKPQVRNYNIRDEEDVEEA